MTVNEFAYCEELIFILSPTLISVSNEVDVPVIVLPPAEKPIVPVNAAVFAVSVKVK